MNPALVAAATQRARRHKGVIAAALMVSPCACGAFLTLGVGAGGGADWWMSQAQAATCTTTTAPGTQIGQWNPEQTGNAQAIVAESQRRNLPGRAAVIAVTTAMTESTLRNLPYGDAPGYVGLFQQFTTWGPLEVRMDPAGAAGLFYDHLVRVPGWEQMPVWQAAQAVQISAFPMAYAKWEADAIALVEQLGVVPSTSSGSCGGGTVVGGYALPLPKDKIVPPLLPHHDYPAVDIPVPSNTPVYAITGGTVRAVGGDCGNGVAVLDAGGNEWIYCHGTSQVVTSGAVNAGDQIMWSGSTGASSGPHLHVQLRRGGPQGSFVCPQPVIEATFAGQPAPTVESLPPSGCVS